MVFLFSVNVYIFIPMVLFLVFEKAISKKKLLQKFSDS